MKASNILAPAARPAAGLQVKATVLVLAVTLHLPFVVHLLPAWGDVPWGARLLPMFYAPFLGAALYRLHVGLLPALLAPALNALVTGLPDRPLVLLLTVELAMFTVVAFLLLSRHPRRWFAAPLAYGVAKGFSSLTVAVLPFLAALRPAADFFVPSVVNALPGLAVLLLLNLWIARREG